MKVDLGPLTPDTIPSVRGGFYIRDTRWGPVAQKWPGPRPNARTPTEAQYRQRFAFAARMAATPYPVELETAIHLSQNTEQVPRDLLTSAAQGRFYEVYWPDGTRWNNVPGPLAWYRPELDVLSWEWSQWDNAYASLMDTFASATKGIGFTPYFNDPITSVRVVFTAVAGAIYRASHGYVNGSNIIQAITNSAVATPPSAGLQVMQFDLASTLVAGSKNFIVLTRTDGASNYALPMNIQTTPKWHIPLLPQGSVRITSLNPIVGNTMNVGSATNSPPFAFLIQQ